MDLERFLCQTKGLTTPIKDFPSYLVITTSLAIGIPGNV